MVRWAVALLVLVGHTLQADGQTLSQRGFVELRGVFFPQEAANDSTRLVADVVAREEVFAKPAPWIQFAGGIDFRANTHEQVADSWRVDVGDRTPRRPRLSVRRLAATFAHGPFTVDVGKQFIRWGKTDIVTPTDRFAPRDFLNVFDSEFLAVTGARGAAQFASETIEAVWTRFTPSRTPLVDQRWTVVTPQIAAIPLVDAGAVFPARSQAGVRWSHSGSLFESALSFFDGFNHLPNVDVNPLSSAIAVRRSYPAVRSYGADAAVPLRWVSIKGEAAFVTSRGSDEYVLYVVQLERQTGEWVFVGGYAGEVVTERRNPLTFSPERGVARSIVGRASYTIDPNRSVALESAVRPSGDGTYVKGEYSQARGAHLRATMTGTLIRGEPSDFIGQYRRNSNIALSVRYSF